MSASQWLEWKTLMTLSPFILAEDRADVRSAQIACAVWNVQIAIAQGSWDYAARNGNQTGSRPEFRQVHEFLSQWGDMPNPHPQEEMKEPGQGLFDSIKEYFDQLEFTPVDRTERVS